MNTIEPLEPRLLFDTAPIFSVNSVKRLYSEVIGGAESPSRSIRYKNVTAKSVTIPAGGVNITGADSTQYHIISDNPLPRGLKPGASMKFSVVFDPPSGTIAGIKTGLLSVQTTTGASKSVRLRGIATTGIGGSNEPSLQRILDLYQYKVNVGDSNSADNPLDLPPVQPNSELAIQKLTKAGTGNVVAYPIAAYVQVVNPSIHFGYYAAGNSDSKIEMFTLADTDAQSVSPNPLGSISFNPGSTAFGLYTTYPGLARTAYSEDQFNTWESTLANRHKARFYAVRNKDGSFVPNAYIVAFEDLDTGEDFQDGVYIIENVKPA